MRKTLATAVLVLALCCTTFAGEIHLPGAPTTPPAQPASAAPEPTLDGEMPTPDEPETLTQIALELLAVLPSLL